MPSSKVTVPHTLGKDEALARIKGMLTQVEAQGRDTISDLQESWNGATGTYSFRARGFTVKGSVLVSDSDVEIDLDYPLAARPFKSRIESALQSRAEALLAA